MKSNAILLARDGASVGIGMGQVNRVDSCHLAVSRAGEERARGAVAASDAFFPFADGLQVLLDAGVRAVVAPGGSMRDAEVVEAAQAAGVTHVLHRHAALRALTRAPAASSEADAVRLGSARPLRSTRRAVDSWRPGGGGAGGAGA